MNLTDADREQHYPTTPVQCACGWRQTDPDAGTWLDHMGAAAVQATTERVETVLTGEYANSKHVGGWAVVRVVDVRAALAGSTDPTPDTRIKAEALREAANDLYGDERAAVADTTPADDMSADVLRRAAALMRERAEAATDGGHGWRVADLPGANEVWANRDAAGHDAFMVASTATRLNPNPGVRGADDAAHIASWHPAVALAVADWLDAEARWADIGAANSPQDEAVTVARAYLGETP